MEPRPAATLVLARPSPEGPEILVLRRGPASRFAPGYVTFPGGSVDPGDRALAARWFGDPSEEVRACVLRELSEEAGLVLSSSGLRAGDRSTAVGLIDADPPRREQVPEMARWVTPDVLPVRFDTRFFAAMAGRGVEPKADGLENDRAWWATPADVLAEHELWTTLMWPTHRTLEALAGCRSVADVLSLRVEPVPPPFPRPVGRKVREP